MSSEINWETLWSTDLLEEFMNYRPQTPPMFYTSQANIDAFNETVLQLAQSGRWSVADRFGNSNLYPYRTEEEEDDQIIK